MPRRLDPWLIALLAALGLLPLVPFAVPVVAALALAAASLPLQGRLAARMPEWAAASVITLLWTVVAVLPLVAIVQLLAPALPQLKHVSFDPDALVAAATRAPWVGALFADHQDTLRLWIVGHQPEQLLASYLPALGTVGAHLLKLLVHAGLTLAILWAVLTGRRQVGAALRGSLHRIVSRPLAERIETHALRSTRAVIVGMVGLALWDMLLSMPMFLLAGLQGWFAWGVTIGLLSTVPGGTGVALVLGAGLLVAGGKIGAGAAVLIVGHVITLSGDFLVKPKIIGATSHAPFLVVLMAIFGGVAMFGLVGLILGPVLVLTAEAVVFDAAN